MPEKKTIQVTDDAQHATHNAKPERRKFSSLSGAVEYCDLKVWQ